MVLSSHVSSENRNCDGGTLKVKEGRFVLVFCEEKRSHRLKVAQNKCVLWKVFIPVHGNTLLLSVTMQLGDTRRIFMWLQECRLRTPDSFKTDVKSRLFEG